MHTYKAAYATARNGTGFLESRQNGQGWMLDEKGKPSENIACYYKTLWAFASAGTLRRANAVADILKGTFLKKSGDFGTPEQRKGEEWFEWRYYTYPNVWIVIGGQKIGRFDLSIPGSEFLARYQDPKSGGFCNERPFPKGSGIEDSISTSSCGNAMLYAGRVAEARRAGDFLVRLLKMQPEIEKRFYAAYDGRSGKLIEQFGEADALYRVIETDVKEQFYFMAGLPIALLAKLYLATGEKRYLNASLEYYEFTARCSDLAYHYPASGKSGFAAAILARITKREDIADAARRQLDFYAKTQAKSGAWESFPGLKLYGDGTVFPISGQIDITAEFTVWSNEMVQELKQDLMVNPGA